EWRRHARETSSDSPLTGDGPNRPRNARAHVEEWTWAAWGSNQQPVLRPHPDVLLQSPGSRLASKDGAVAIDRHELRSVAGGLPWITPGIQDECIDPSRSGIANPDPFLPTGVLHVIGFRVGHVDLP